MAKFILREIGQSKANAVQGIGLIPAGALEIPKDFNENILNKESLDFITEVASNYTIPRSIKVTPPASLVSYGEFQFNYIDQANMARTPYETPIPGIYGQNLSGENAEKPVYIPLFDFRDIPLPSTGKLDPQLFRKANDSELTLTSLDAILYENKGFSSFSDNYTMAGKITRADIPSGLTGDAKLVGQRASYAIGSVPYNYLSLLSFGNSYSKKAGMTAALASQYDASYNFYGPTAAGTTSKAGVSSDGFLKDGTSFVALSSFNVYAASNDLTAYVSIRGMEVPMKCVKVAKMTEDKSDFVVSFPRYLLDADVDIIESIDYMRISDTSIRNVYYSDSRLFASDDRLSIYENSDGNSNDSNYSDAAATLNVVG